MQPVIDKFSDPVEGSTKYSHVKLAERVHIEAFIDILYLRAVFRWNILDREIIWNHESAHDIIGPTMSLNRFKFICRLITFDNKEIQIDRWKADKFACMRDLFEDMNDRNATVRYSSLLLAIDETFYPYREHIGFKRYNPSKPAKYGLLYRSVCNFSITYTYYSLPYAGKPEKVEGPAFAAIEAFAALHYRNRRVFQISHQRTVCLLQPSRDQYIHGLLLHISFFGKMGLI